MNETDKTPTRSRLTIVRLIAIAAVAVVAAATHRQWLPHVRSLIATENAAETGHPDDHQHASGQGHVNDDQGPVHDGHDHASALEMSELARKNIGLTTGIVTPQTYVKTVSVPAMIVERPGRSQVEITAPLTGTVTRVFPTAGEVVEPGAPLFELRLTHEDLVTAQREFLKFAQEHDVVSREIERLKALGEGVIAGRRVLELEYERQKTEVAVHSQRQGLLLHGLAESQITEILESRTLLQTLTVYVPPFPKNGDHAQSNHLFHVQQIRVKPGGHVTAGDSLAILADHCLLYVEGQAFEDDAERLIQVADEGWLLGVAAVASRTSRAPPTRLKILYVADQIDPESRALRFYLSLPNEPTRDEEQSGHRFVAWKYRPGQRMEVQIPLGEPWENQIVLPSEAVVIDGADAFVFEQNGDHFDRLPIHIVFRDKDAVVIENDSSMIGSTLAMSGAYEMHLALKNKSGGGVDPHAGHNH